MHLVYLGIPGAALILMFSLSETVVMLPWFRWSLADWSNSSESIVRFLAASFSFVHYRVGRQDGFSVTTYWGVVDTLSCLLALASGRKLRGRRSCVGSRSFDHWCGR